MISHDASPRDASGPTEIEQFVLTGFKWGALGLTAILATALLASILGFLASAIGGASNEQAAQLEVAQDRTLARYAADPPRLRRAARLVDLPQPVFTSMPEATRKAAYQALYDRILGEGQSHNLIGDEATLITVVNGAITELDGANEPAKGTYAYVYLAELAELAEALGERRDAQDQTIPARLTLEALAQGVADDIRTIRAAREAEQGTSQPADLAAGSSDVFVILGLTMAMLLSALSWAALAFIAQGRTYWIVQQR